MNSRTPLLSIAAHLLSYTLAAGISLHDAHATSPPPADNPTTAPAPCPAAFPAAPPTQPALRQAELTRLNGLGDPCQNRPDYFAYYGALLLTATRPQEAAVALEKALMLAPELGGVQLDYAQALAELGEISSARQLASDIAARPDLPPNLQTWLTHQIGHWDDDAWHFAWSIDLMLGTESNLNSSPNLRYLTLTLPSGRVPLELDTSEDSISGKAIRSDILITAARHIAQGTLQLGAEHLIRQSPGNNNTRYELANANLAYSHPLWGGQWGARTEHTRIAIGILPVYLGNSWNLVYQLPGGLLPEGCNLGLGRAGEKREYPSTTHQNGHYTGHLAQISCHQDNWLINLGAQRGKDRALDPIRLGGNQQRTDATLTIGKRLPGNLLALTLSNSRARDEQVYSPLLGNEARHIKRRAARLTWEHPINRHWSLIGQLESTTQTSNIELFGMQNRTLYFGLRVH